MLAKLVLLPCSVYGFIVRTLTRYYNIVCIEYSDKLVHGLGFFIQIGTEKNYIEFLLIFQ